MIIPTHKHLIIGSSLALDEFFADAQKKGFIEFIDPKKQKKQQLSENVDQLLLAMKILRQRELKSKEGSLDISTLDLAKQIIEADARSTKLHEEKRLLRMEASRIRVFGDFSLEDLQYLEDRAKRFVQFYSLKASKKKDIVLPQELIYVSTEGDLDYFIGVHKEKTTYPDLIEMVIEKPLGLVLCDLKDVEKEIHHQEQILQDASKHYASLEKQLLQELDEAHLIQAKGFSKSGLEEKVFSIEAYIPENKEKEFEALIKKRPIYTEKIPLDEEDKPPTYMENQGYAQIGEDLVHVYDTPATSDLDPSAWVFWAFAVFYAMIMADAGYAMLYLLFALYLRKAFPHWTGVKKRCRTLLTTIASFGILWGVLTASYFGIQLSPDNPIRKYSFIHYLATMKAEYHLEKQDETYQEWLSIYPKIAEAKTGQEFFQTAVKVEEDKTEYKALGKFCDAILMEISLLVGVIHLLGSFFRMVRRAPSGIGWALSMVGGYLYFPKFIGAISLLNFTGLISVANGYFFGEIFLYLGFSLAVFIAVLHSKIYGLFEIANALQVFADVLSYLRLYALGLAGMIMADTFNQIGMSFGWVFGPFVIILGHSINISLGVMGGVIHGLRLNFLEWYRYCFDGGGRPFNPLKLLDK